MQNKSGVQKLSYKIINAITLYRIIMAPVLVILIFTKQIDVFKWLLALSFFTDLIDGVLARRFKVKSILGSKLDSIGDDLTILAATIGLFVFKYDFIRDQFAIFIIPFSLFVLQTMMALVRYRKMSSFHTYLAKGSAILQGLFLILIFILHSPVYPLFYAAAFLTTLDLIEEIILVLVLPRWEANVKGLYWVVRRKK